MKSTGKTEYDVLIAMLTRMREGAGLSQSEMARRIGRKQPYIWKIENGQQRIDVVEVLDYVDVTGNDFLAVMTEFHTAVKKKRISKMK